MANLRFQLVNKINVQQDSQQVSCISNLAIVLISFLCQFQFQFLIKLLEGIKIELNGEDKQRFEELTEIPMDDANCISVNSSNCSLSSPLSSIFIPSRSFNKN